MELLDEAMNQEDLVLDEAGVVIQPFQLQELRRVNFTQKYAFIISNFEKKLF